MNDVTCSNKSRSSVNRRDVLFGAASSALVAAYSHSSAASPEAHSSKIVAAVSEWRFAGERPPVTGVWTYNGIVPGPEIRVRQGTPVRILVENRLSEGTTTHWHGIRL